MEYNEVASTTNVVDSSSVAGCVASSDNIASVPCVGMEFVTATDAYNFYNSYALRVGFGVRKTSGTYSKKKNEERTLIGTTFVCDREGKKFNYVNDGSSRERESRVGCHARMRIVYTKRNTWEISTFVEAHNGHELTSPNKTMKHRSHSVVHRSQPVTDLMDRLRDQGLALTHISRALNAGSGSTENAITSQQCHSHLRRSRDNNVGAECRLIINQFANKKLSDADFYYAWEVEQDGTMKSVFWADGMSRSSYMQFGDVVVFDVTYKTNNLCLPFAPFTGVNHHGQSILFGCALLADEQEETFVWLFSEWLRCMHGQAPASIITDQDIAIGNAIGRVFPASRHRYCSWHISQHIIQHLPKLRIDYGEEIGSCLTKWMKSSNVEEAEIRWTELKEKFNVDENANTWLPTMYQKRQHWIKAYLNDAFWAGGTSTQRSESMNSFFDGFVNARTRINEFIGCYDKALEHRRAAELHEDFMTLSTRPTTENSHAIEVQAGKVYTRSIFKKFREQMVGRDKLIRNVVSRVGSTIVYSITSAGNDSDTTHHVVYEEGESASAKCSCALFETMGLLCKHILSIMCAVYQLQAIPDKYILPRWRIDARHRSIRSLMHDSEQEILLKLWIVRSEFNEVWQLTDTNEQVLEMHEWISSFKARHGLVKKTNLNASQASSNVLVRELELADYVTIREPSGPVVNKGRPKKSTRYPSGVEPRPTKKQRTCQNCGQKGHYRNTCKNPPAKCLPPTQEKDDEDDDNGDSSCWY